MPDGVRCRRSICTHNHAQVACPRCGERDLESVAYAEGHYSYTCRECTNTWKVKG
jgi:transposase-like protein